MLTLWRRTWKAVLPRNFSDAISVVTLSIEVFVGNDTPACLGQEFSGF